MTPYRAGNLMSSPPPAVEPYDPDTYLPPRERDVLHGMAEGLTVPEMARRWHASAGTVRGWQQSLYKRLGVNTGTHAVAVAFRRGILAADPDVTAAVAVLRQAAELGYRLAVVPWPAACPVAAPASTQAPRDTPAGGIGYAGLAETRSGGSHLWLCGCLINDAGVHNGSCPTESWCGAQWCSVSPSPHPRGPGCPGRPGPAETATARQETPMSETVELPHIVAAWLVAGHVNDLWGAWANDPERPGCCPDCCAPCGALKELLHLGLLDELYGYYVDNGGGQSSAWDADRRQVGRDWLTEAWSVDCGCHNEHNDDALESR